MSYFDDVGEFNKKFDLPHATDESPRLLNMDLLMFRINFMQEELREFVEATDRRDIVEAADALVDLVYVALGTAHMMHIPFDACWQEVQRSNMDKVRANGAADPLSKRKHALDVVKPEGWKPPDLKSIIRAAVR
jgi:predicted HAD superfamily Cof-like phosphohydrolase